MTEERALPTVMLVEGAMYWVLPRYGTPEQRWTVAKWEVGCFWGIGGGEISPGVISGPIPHPAENSAQGSERSDEGNLPPDALNTSSSNPTDARFSETAKAAQRKSEGGAS